MKYKKLKTNIKYSRIFCLCILSFAFCLFFPLFPVFSQERVESDHYRITWPNLNMGAGVGSTSPNFKVGITTGQTAPGRYISTGYLIRAGFQYIHSIIPFSFAVSDFSIAFGTLTAGVPATHENLLTISTGGAAGYQVTAQANHRLQTTSGVYLDDTGCDPADPCTHLDPGAWSSDTTYGFGYTVTSADAHPDFAGGLFKQFADASVPEDPQIVMTSANVGIGRTATVTFKINAAPIQAAGTYQNLITFTAVPGY